MIQTIITLAALVSSLGALTGAFAGAVRWKAAREENDEALGARVRELKTETGLLCRGLLACLDGLEQLGANHSVPAARKEINDYLNERAHS